MNVGTETKQNLVPHFIKAKSAQGLIDAMLDNNLLEKKEIKYQDISFNFKDGFWYAWFYKETDDFIRIKNAKVK